MFIILRDVCGGTLTEFRFWVLSQTWQVTQCAFIPPMLVVASKMVKTIKPASICSLLKRLLSHYLHESFYNLEKLLNIKKAPKKPEELR